LEGEKKEELNATSFQINPAENIKENIDALNYRNNNRDSQGGSSE
jgi:hypothetical protein